MKSVIVPKAFGCLILVVYCMVVAWCSAEGNQIFRVRLSVLENYKDARVTEVVNRGIVPEICSGLHFRFDH